MIITIGVNERFDKFLNRGILTRDPACGFKMTARIGPVTSKMPERALRVVCTLILVASVLPVDRPNWSDWMQGTRRISRVRYSIRILAPTSWWNLEVVEALEAWDESSL